MNDGATSSISLTISVKKLIYNNVDNDKIAEQRRGGIIKTKGK
jgi:hypothetical protein